MILTKHITQEDAHWYDMIGPDLNGTLKICDWPKCCRNMHVLFEPELTRDAFFVISVLRSYQKTVMKPLQISISTADACTLCPSLNSKFPVMTFEALKLHGVSCFTDRKAF